MRGADARKAKRAGARLACGSGCGLAMPCHATLGARAGGSCVGPWDGRGVGRSNERLDGGEEGRWEGLGVGCHEGGGLGGSVGACVGGNVGSWDGRGVSNSPWYRYLVGRVRLPSKLTVG